MASASFSIDERTATMVYEGIGAVSAGASSRLLVDYPEPARSQILDYLFKPNYGAGFQHLKVEVGSDINSTDGTEPSHMRSRGEENYHRGYEWWLMREAVARNPEIILDCLAWGAPGWIGNGSIYSPDMAEYYARFILGAKREHGLSIRHVGIWNEHDFDADWIKLLRRTLDQHDLQGVGIVANDMNGPPEHQYKIAHAAAADQELASCIHALGIHYPYGGAPEVAQQLQRKGMRLWSSEEGEWNWQTMWPLPDLHAQKCNRNYLERRMTKTEFWSLVTAYHDCLVAPRSGVVVANTPWSGAFTVLPNTWQVAHITQFAKPGWRYVDSGCMLLPAGGSAVSLLSPDGRDLSIVIETTGAACEQTVTFTARATRLRVWQTGKRVHFQQSGDVRAEDGRFTFVAEPDMIYSLTTTTGQRKGDAPSPPASRFPESYCDDFENYAVGQTPKYLCDLGGAFEVARRFGGGKCLRQVISGKGIDWAKTDYSYSLLGEPACTDQHVMVQAALADSGAARPKIGGHYVAVIARFHTGNTFAGFSEPHPRGYSLRLHSDGRWQVLTSTAELASGTVAAPGEEWHRLELRCVSDCIMAAIDGQEVCRLTDATYSGGLAGIGCGLHPAEFDNLRLETLSYCEPARN